jgi:long-chain fatty acid transport protein
LALYETGAPDLGTASAGRAAMAADASTAGANPAGMTLLDRSQLLAASGAMLPAINFNRGSETNVPGGGSGGGNAGVFMPLGAFFYVYRLSERIRLGVAADSNFGLAVDYGKQWAGRYYLTKSSLVAGQVNPSIAYRVTDWLSVGAGFSFSVARFYDQAKINNPLPRFGDGGLSIMGRGVWRQRRLLTRTDQATANRINLQLTCRFQVRLSSAYHRSRSRC